MAIQPIFVSLSVLDNCIEWMKEGMQDIYYVRI